MFLSRFATTASIVGFAGCATRGTSYNFSTLPIADSLDELTRNYVIEEPVEKRPQFAIDYPRSYKRSIVDTLLNEGSVDVINWQISYDRTFGTTSRPRPCFIRAGDSYYSITETDRREITESRWVFYLDLVDEEPNDSDRVITEPPSSLSDVDRKIVRRAVQTVASNANPVDRGAYPLGDRGTIFHSQMDHTESDLVPSPPFDYFEHDGDYFAARSERGNVTLTEYTFTAEEVATSMRELQRVVKQEHVNAVFATSDLTSNVQEILRTATDVSNGRLYTEKGRMSDGLKEVTKRLGMYEYLPKEPRSDEQMQFRGATFRYEDKWYNGSLWTR